MLYNLLIVKVARQGKLNENSVNFIVTVKLLNKLNTVFARFGSNLIGLSSRLDAVNEISVPGCAGLFQ